MRIQRTTYYKDTKSQKNQKYEKFYLVRIIMDICEIDNHPDHSTDCPAVNVTFPGYCTPSTAS